MRHISALLAFACSFVAAAGDKFAKSHAYCIVGGGPAGLQLGHFFKHAKRDYVMFDRGTTAGAFFQKFPRHRKLISLNKRFVREGRSAEFALRHDWNSLLDVRPEAEQTPPVTTRSEELFPVADVLVNYLNEYAVEQEPFIRFQTDVRHIARAADGGFDVTIAVGVGSGSMGDYKEGDYASQTTEIAHCKEVIIAAGFTRARGAESAVDGVEHLNSYEDVESTGETYAGKSVVILGLGNAAMETAQALMPYTSEVHLYARGRELPQGGKGVRFAYETHYVGDIRAGRTAILDTYLLKSLDSFDISALDTDRIVVIPCSGTRRCIWSVSEADCIDDKCKKEFSIAKAGMCNTTDCGQGGIYKLPIANVVKGGKVAAKLRAILKQHVPEARAKAGAFAMVPAEILREKPEFTKKWTAEDEAKSRKNQGIDDTNYNGKFEELSVRSDELRSNPALMDALVPFRARYTEAENRFPKDHVIKCFGWFMDPKVFDEKLMVRTTHKGKYPAIFQNYSAKGVPGLHFAGTLTHGLDFRHSAGGFIHGFRYTARALFKYLEERNYGVEWPSKYVDIKEAASGEKSPVNVLGDMLLKRVNEASGPYQMFYTLGDGIVFDKDPTTMQWTARYMEEVPLMDFHERYKNKYRVTWKFRYGKGFYGPQVLGDDRVGSTSMWTGHKSKFLHPHVEFFEKNLFNFSKTISLTEDIYTNWVGLSVYSPVMRFMSKVLAKVTGDAQFKKQGSFREDYDYEDEKELYMRRPPAAASKQEL